MPWSQRRAGSKSSADGGFARWAGSPRQPAQPLGMRTPAAPRQQQTHKSWLPNTKPDRDPQGFLIILRNQGNTRLLDQTQPDASTRGEPLSCAPPPNQSTPFFFFFFKSPLTTSPCFADDTGWKKQIEGPSKGSLTTPRFSEAVLLKLAT